MELTRRTDYALRMLVYLTANPEEIVSVRTLAESMDVPYAFARSIQRSLSEVGFIKTKLGSTGGITLARNPQEISVNEIITAVQENTSMAVCGRDPEWCNRMETCKSHAIWVEADALVTQLLEKKKLADLV